jgi:hydroxymethylpyrimidine/phosphomethylpyrimidine kinase
MLIPETQSNLVYVKDNHILGINGRIIKHGEHVRAGYIDENSSKHVASALSTARRYTDFKAAINIKYDEHIIKIAKELGFTVSSYDRSKEPKEIKEKEGMSIVWGINEAFANLIPDIVYHIGDIGKEAMITIFAKDLNELIDKITKILKYYSADRSQ